MTIRGTYTVTALLDVNHIQAIDDRVESRTYTVVRESETTASGLRQCKGCGDDRLGPVRCVRKIHWSENLSVFHMQNQLR